MKQILISIFLSFALNICWATVVLTSENYGVISEETSQTLAIPFRLPVYIYENLLGFEIPYSNDEEYLSSEEIFLYAFFILFDVLMYALFIYLIIELFKRFFFNKTSVQKIENPPNPPIFNEKDSNQFHC